MAFINSGTIKPCVRLMTLTTFLKRGSLVFMAVPSAYMLEMEWQPCVKY